MNETIIINGCSFNLKAIKIKNFVLAGECLGDFTNKENADEMLAEKDKLCVMRFPFFLLVIVP